MTVQVAEKLINDHPRVKLKGLQLYAVIRGDVHANYSGCDRYVFATPPQRPKNAGVCSACWRGYVSTYRLNREGELELLSRSYGRVGGKHVVQTVNEKLTGDFWLIMRPSFDELRTCVPFRDGKLVEDPAQWVHEEGNDSGPAP